MDEVQAQLAPWHKSEYGQNWCEDHVTVATGVDQCKSRRDMQKRSKAQAETRGTVFSSVLETPTFGAEIIIYNQPNVLNACPDILDNQPV